MIVKGLGRVFSFDSYDGVDLRGFIEVLWLWGSLKKSEIEKNIKKCMTMFEQLDM
jgi:hypothetical protein